LYLVDTIFDFRAAYRSENLPLKYEQLVLLPFGQHPHLTAVEQDWADQGLVNGEFTSHALNIINLDKILGEFTRLIFKKNKKVIKSYKILIPDWNPS
jgi:hypothetical protein